MKKIFSVVLALLMLLPTLASLAFALELPSDAEIVNVANEATISVAAPANGTVDVGSTVDFSRLVDGDVTTGSASPIGFYYSYFLDFAEVKYFTELVINCNGSGTLAYGSTVKYDTYNVKAIVVRIYDGSDLVYESEALDVSNTKQVKLEPNQKGTRVEIFKASGSNDRKEYMWEIATYAPKDFVLCDAKTENVIKEATFSATRANANYWHAMDWKALTDGNIKTGTHSPKGRNYSIWMHFPKEYLFSQIDIECNTDGGAKLASGGTVDGKLYAVLQMRVLVYNYNEDLVWDSDLVDTSTITTLELAPLVEGAIIEIQIYNGNFGGGEYLYEVAAYAQSGNHVFDMVSEENPSCSIAGIRDYVCHCGKKMRESLAPTGFHTWDDGVVTQEATATENGILTKTCTVCSVTKEFDLPATAHSWDSGTTVLPDCEKEGYDLYKCTDDGCEATYKKNYVYPLGHNWDDGTLTTKPTVETEGVTTYKCLRDGCEGTKTHRVRKHKYTDNTVPFTNDDIEKFEVYVNKDHSLYKSESYEKAVNDGAIKPDYLFDGDKFSWWYATPGSYIDVTLKKNYVFTSGLFYASSNWSSMKIEFMNLNPDYSSLLPESDTNPKYIVTATFNAPNLDNGSNSNAPKELDMLDSLAGGTIASKIRITTIDPKWENGSGCKLQELSLLVHDCVFTEVDYIYDDSNYIAPSCNTDGQCTAVCQVCAVKSIVKLESGPNVGHTVAQVIADQEATCSDDGFGHGICSKCNTNIEGITIKATGEHDFSVDYQYMSAKCGFAGIGQKICADCGKVGAQYEIAPTGIHIHEWTTRSSASYTAEGKTVYACKFCGISNEIDPELGTNIIVEDKIAIPEDFLTFVGVTATTGTENTLSFKYKINLSYIAEIQKTCDIRVITNIKDEIGREASIESYGKYSTNSYDPTTGEFTVTIYPSKTSDKFEVNTVVRLMNFRGIVYKVCPMTGYTGTISIDDVK